MFIFACALINKYDDNDKEAEKSRDNNQISTYLDVNKNAFSLVSASRHPINMDVSIFSLYYFIS